MTLPVLYVDNHLLVIDKPAGVLSQEDRTSDADVLTLAKAWVKVEYEKPGKVYLGLVHRLDRPASGVMVLARTSKAAARLSEQFRNRTISKTYLALVSGMPEDGEVYEDWLLKRSETVQVVDEHYRGAKHAKMRVHVVRKIGQMSLIRVELSTGRAHQIRVQCAHRGHPIVGDFRYGSRSELDGRNLALHAFSLGLEHPTKKKRMTFHALPPATWPDDAIDVAARLTGK